LLFRAVFEEVTVCEAFDLVFRITFQQFVDEILLHGGIGQVFHFVGNAVKVGAKADEFLAAEASEMFDVTDQVINGH